VPLAPNQFIAKRFSQTSQSVADRGLGDRQVAGSLGQALFGHDLIKDPKQVQVKGSEIGLNGINHFNCE
jgi:hypothetical protein